jgi:hypothetical protein
VVVVVVVVVVVLVRFAWPAVIAPSVWAWVLETAGWRKRTLEERCKRSIG